MDRIEGAQRTCVTRSVGDQCRVDLDEEQPVQQPIYIVRVAARWERAPVGGGKLDDRDTARRKLPPVDEPP
jgi:hypothetical protein